MATDHDAPAPGADEGTDIEVVILEGEGDGAASGNEGAAPAAKGGEGEPDYAALKRMFEEERAGKQEALRRADAATREVQGAQASAVDGRLGQTVSAIEGLKGHAADLKRQFAEASAAGDYAKAADLTEKIGEAGATMARLVENKAHFENLKKNPAVQRAPAPASADPVEAFAAGRPPKEQAWIRANPEFVRDPKKLQKLQGAHQMAVADHEPGSDGYFDAINATLGIKPVAVPATRRAAPVAAPVSRDGGGVAGGTTRSPQSVTLTASEAAMAKQMGVPLKDYAREKAKVAAAIARGETL